MLASGFFSDGDREVIEGDRTRHNESKTLWERKITTQCESETDPGSVRARNYECKIGQIV